MQIGSDRSARSGNAARLNLFQTCSNGFIQCVSRENGRLLIFPGHVSTLDGRDNLRVADEILVNKEKRSTDDILQTLLISLLIRRCNR